MQPAQPAFPARRQYPQERVGFRILVAQPQTTQGEQLRQRHPAALGRAQRASQSTCLASPPKGTIFSEGIFLVIRDWIFHCFLQALPFAPLSSEKLNFTANATNATTPDKPWPPRMRRSISGIARKYVFRRLRANACLGVRCIYES